MESVIEKLYNQYLKTRQITTDSRQITPGCIFFALKGENFDGNAFAQSALDQGAALCVIDNPQYQQDERCLLVENVLETLQDLARHHRSQLHIPVIGITGTNGKTTTKELVNAVLSKRYRTHATQGNHNNHLGVPLTILSTPENTEILIVEMGANHPGEIEFLCDIANPEFGLITNVGRAHLEGFGSFEGVIRTKTELYRHLQKQQGVIFVNADNPILYNEAASLVDIPGGENNLTSSYGITFPSVDFSSAPAVSLITYGKSPESQIKGVYVGSEPYMKMYFEVEDCVYTVQSQLLGGYNFDNAMAALCTGLFFGVEPFYIKEALEQYSPNNNRSQFKKTEHNALYLDCYNANPSSMEVAISNFEALNASPKTVILGEMKELGTESHTEHQKVVKLLKDCHFSKIILVGKEFQFAQSDDILWFPTSLEAKRFLSDNPLCNNTILLKGSNGTKMWILEEVL